MTPRLLLREWRPADEPAMAAINSDPEVARYLNRPASPATVAAFYEITREHWRTHGYGPWAIESRRPQDQGRFLGFAGLAHLPPFLSEAGTGPEIGWRLARHAWGQGLATEAVIAARDDALARLGLKELISVIHPGNQRSRRVAEKLDLHPARQVLNPVLGVLVDVWSSLPETGTAQGGY
jgi:RimJ/RimL family protein N-acetyltransferase